MTGLLNRECSFCPSTDVISVETGEEAEYWPGRSLDDQDFGGAPILLKRAKADICWCLRCWIAAFRRVAA